MAGPKVFVAGPGVNPNLIGSPASFLSNIGKIASGRRTDRRQRDELAQNKIFQDATQALNLRKQEFAEAQPDRARAEKLFETERANAAASEIAKRQLAAVSGSGGSGLEPFLENPEAQAFLTSKGIKTPEAQREYVSKFMDAGNRQLFSNPQKQSQQAYETVIAEGGSLDQATSARNAVLAKYPVMSAEQAAALNANKGGIDMGKIFGSGSVTGGAGKPVQSAPSQKSEEELRDILTNRMSIEDARGGGLVDSLMNAVGWGDPTRSVWDVWERDLDQGDVDRLVGNYGNRYAQHAIVGALRSVINPDDGTIDQDKWQNIMNSPGSADAKAFETEVKNWQSKAERTRGGNAAINNMSATDIFKMASQLQKSQDNRTMQIFGRTAPQGRSFADQLSAVEGSFPIDTTRQGGGNQGGPILTPKVAPVTETVDEVETEETPQAAAGGTGSVGLDSLLTPAPSAGPAEFPIGGPVEVPGERVFSKIKDTVTDASFAPARVIGKLFKDLTPPGPGVLEQRPPTQSRQAQVDSFTQAERSDAMTKARALSKQRKISVADADGEGNSADEALLIAYLKYLEGE